MQKQTKIEKKNVIVFDNRGMWLQFYLSFFSLKYFL
jgi:hypothetical protein